MNRRNLNRDLIDIYNHFGGDSQLFKLQEEMIELDIELDKFLGGEKNSTDMLWEMADVFIVFSQILLALTPQSRRLLRHMILKKIARTKKRIESGYYD